MDAASDTSEAPTLQRPPALRTSEPRLATVTAAAAAHQEENVPVEGTRVRRTRTTAFFRGYWYTRAWVSSRKIAYRCSHYRQGCRGTMEFRMVSMGFAVVRPHTCRDHEVQAEAIDVYVAMAGVVDSLALADLSVPPSSIWDSVRAQFCPDDGDNVVRGLTEQQTITRVYRVHNVVDSLTLADLSVTPRSTWDSVCAQFCPDDGDNVVRGLAEQRTITRVYRIRNRAYGGERYGVIERSPMSMLRAWFHHVVANTDPTQILDRIIGWSHPALFNLLRYHSVSLSIGGNFRWVPRCFAHCVVLMVHDSASGLFVPACFVLTTNRTADTYWDLIHCVIQATDQQLEPTAVVCDFEAGLLSAIETQFPNAHTIGCLFHFKQAVRRKMKSCRFLSARHSRNGCWRVGHAHGHRAG